MGQNSSVFGTIANAVFILLLGVVYVVLLSAVTALTYVKNLLTQIKKVSVRLRQRLYAKERASETR